jgi:hypothetical protein
VTAKLKPGIQMAEGAAARAVEGRADVRPGDRLPFCSLKPSYPSRRPQIRTPDASHRVIAWSGLSEALARADAGPACGPAAFTPGEPA